MTKQLSFSMVDEVGSYFETEIIKSLCQLIDEKVSRGLAYGDLKEDLIEWMEIEQQEEPINPEIYGRCYDFVMGF